MNRAANLLNSLKNTLVSARSVGVLVFFAWCSANAATSGITYHGRIIKPNGSALESTSVQFKLQIRTPDSTNCLLFEETKTLDMRNTAGVFDLTINDGTGARTDTTGLALDTLFANRGTLNGTNCAVTGAYSPSPADGRRFQVSFKDENMTTWEPLPAQALNFIPLAIESKQVGGFAAGTLMRVEDAGGPSPVASLTTLQYNELFALSSGSSTNYLRTSSNSAYVPTRAGAPTSPTAGQFWFDTGTSQLKYYDGSTTQTLASGGSLPALPSGTLWVGNGSNAATSVTLSGDATLSSGGALALKATGTAGSYFKVTTDAQGRVTAGSAALVEAEIPTLSTSGKVNGSAITGTIGGAVIVNTTGTVTASGLSSNIDSTQNLWLNEPTNTYKVVVKAPASLAADYTLTLPATAGTAGYVLTTSGPGGLLSWTPSSSGSVTSVTGTAPVTVGGTAAAPVVSMAPASGSTPGYLSAADYTTFNGKLSSSLADGKIWVGNSGTASAVTPSGDATISNTGVVSVVKLQGRAVASTTPVTSQVLRYNTATSTWENQYLNVTDLKKADGTTQFQSATCGAGQTLNWSALTDLFTCTTISITSGQVTGLGTAAALNAGVAANNVVQLSASAKLPAVDGSALTNLSASSFGSGIMPVANGGTGTATGSITGTGALAFVAGGTNQDVALTPSGTGSTTLGGKVGIGTTTPSSALSLDGSAVRTIGMERAPIASVVAGNDLTIQAGGASAGGSNLYGGNLILSSGQSTGSATGSILLQTPGGTSTATADSAMYTAMTVTGNYGPGQPNTTLVGIGGPASSVLNMVSSGNNGGAGHVALSNTYPGSLARAYFDASSNTATTAFGSTSNAYTGDAFVGTNAGFLATGGAGGLAIESAGGSANIRFATAGNATTNERLRIDSTGNVGINNTNPAAKLDIIGASGTTLKIVDGNQGVGKVLMSDASGVATWTTIAAGGVTAVTATAPVVSSGGATPVISMAASTASVDGYLKSTDFTTFAAKQSSTLTNGSLWVGNGSNVATAVALSSDVTITNAGVATVGKIQGRTVASTTPVTSQYLRYNTATTTWEVAYMNVADLKKSDGTTQFQSASCAAGQTLTWSLITDLFTCTTISITKSQVSDLGTIGTAAAQNVGTAANNVVQLDGTAKIPASLLPAGTASQWTTNSGNIYFNTGNVGIGNNAPANKFYVTGGATNASDLASSQSTAAVFIQPKNSSGYSLAMGSGPSDLPYIQNVNLSGTAAGDMLIQPYGGALGIGTTSPASTLHVNSSQNTQMYLSSSGTNGRNWSLQSAGANGSAQDGTFQIIDRTAGVARMTFDTAGNVGIGTSSPTSPLTIVGAGANYAPWGSSVQNTNSLSTAAMQFQSDSIYSWFGAGGSGNGGGAVIGVYQNAPIVFLTNNTQEKMRIAGDGKVGIGTTSPTQPLEVNGNVRVGSQTTRTTASSRGQLAQGSTYVTTSNASVTIDWNNGNIQELNTFACDGTKVITMNNMTDGGSYTLLFTGSAVHTGVCNFAGTGLGFKTSGGATGPMSTKDALFTFAVINATVIYSMLDNLQ